MKTTKKVKVLPRTLLKRAKVGEEGIQILINLMKSFSYSRKSLKKHRSKRSTKKRHTRSQIEEKEIPLSPDKAEEHESNFFKI